MEEFTEKLASTIRNLYGLEHFTPELAPSPDNIDADYSSNAPLKLAKELHKPPMDISEEILEAFVSIHGNGSERGGEQKASISPPGFLNFTLSDNYLKSQINTLSTDFNKAISSRTYQGQTVICEFSDPNPFKVLHVGHLYTSIVGDSISRLFEYAGANVIRANFGGDVGLHVAKTMYILQQTDTKDLTIEDIARCYIEGTAAYDDDEKAHQAITELNKELYKINAEGLADGRVTDLEGLPQSSRREELREGKVWQDPPRENYLGSNLANLYWRARELSYDYFRAFYASIGIKFDKYYPESTVAALGLAKVKEQLRNGVYTYSDGAVVFDGDKYGLHTRVFINQEGVPTYEAKDVGLIFTKWHDYHFDKSVVITGGEQKDYMAVVLKSVEQYAPNLVAKTTHLTHGLVKLPGGVKMSSRKGNFLKAVDVLEMVRLALEQEYGSTDPLVSLAAIKYAFLKYKMGGQIIFDPHESVKMTGNSGPYLLYSAVRAKKILSNSKDSKSIDNYTYSTHEKTLSKKLLEYSSLLQEAVVEMAPHKVANYLYELAQDFSRFYEHCPVIGSPEEQERIKLVRIYLDVMTHGLNILGITIPEEM